MTRDGRAVRTPAITSSMALEGATADGATTAAQGPAPNTKQEG
ncbi:hypothetical protein [Arthrobacter polaris]|nr:hypothetical protein [Arthrobacter polaris]